MKQRDQSRQLFRQNQFSLTGALQTVKLALVLDPDFITTASEVRETEDFRSEMTFTRAFLVRRFL